MQTWMRRIRGALGMGLTWFAGWVAVGFLMEFVDPNGQIADIWPAVLGIPGFIGGVVFSAVLGIAASRRRFDELSLPLFGALGAGAGVLGVLPFAISADIARAAVFLASTTTLGAISAVGTLAIARMADDRELLTASEDVSEVGLSESEARKLLGRKG
jgi:hypothetical protein